MQGSPRGELFAATLQLLQGLVNHHEPATAATCDAAATSSFSFRSGRSLRRSDHITAATIARLAPHVANKAPTKPYLPPLLARQGKEAQKDKGALWGIYEPRSLLPPPQGLHHYGNVETHREREGRERGFWRYIGANPDFWCCLNVEKHPQNVVSMSNFCSLNVEKECSKQGALYILWAAPYLMYWIDTHFLAADNWRAP